MSNTHLITKFPSNIELSYDTVEHNKVSHYDMCIAIPEGKRCYLWFTYDGNNKIAALCYTDNTDIHKIIKITPINCCFDSNLSLGTIFHGTLVHYNNVRFFAIDDIVYYKGKPNSRLDYKSKFKIISYALNYEISQKVFTNHDLLVGLPIIEENRQQLISQFDVLPYNISQIKYISFNKHTETLFSPFSRQKYTIHYDNSPTAVFKINASTQNDIYNLYCYNKGDNNYYYDTAFIPDYKTSVMMNKLFRNIKENDNLDCLEESDDEDEFENINEDKFLLPNKNINMLCNYNYRFKKWVPVKEIRGNKICPLQTLRELEKNNTLYNNHNHNHNNNNKKYNNNYVNITITQPKKYFKNNYNKRNTR